MKILSEKEYLGLVAAFAGHFATPFKPDQYQDQQTNNIQVWVTVANTCCFKTIIFWYLQLHEVITWTSFLKQKILSRVTITILHLGTITIFYVYLNIATGETSQVITSRHFSSLLWLFSLLSQFYFFDHIHFFDYFHLFEYLHFFEYFHLFNNFQFFDFTSSTIPTSFYDFFTTTLLFF